MECDAIVNAANSSLLGGGGVDGAIHRAAGPELLAECSTLGGCPTGQAKITGGYRLPAKYVIHTVGPIWYGGNQGEAELLASCYRNSLALADAYHCESVAFPMISTGVYRYPKEEALTIAVHTISQFLMTHDMLVYLVVFGGEALAVSQKLFQDVRQYIDDVYVEAHLSNQEARRKALWQKNRVEAAKLDQEYARADYSAVYADADSEAQPLPDWDSLFRQADEGFSGMLLRLIDEKGMTDAQCYKKANVDRRLFSKIRSDPEYRPSKPTVFAFVMALELPMPAAKELLRKAGFALTRSSKLDVVMEYCIRERFYDVLQINEVLYELDLPLLGNSNVA
jgi:O-acetyl-ADP-ribose deacetylase (regulator of RNase III)